MSYASSQQQQQQSHNVVSRQQQSSLGSSRSINSDQPRRISDSGGMGSANSSRDSSVGNYSTHHQSQNVFSSAHQVSYIFSFFFFFI